MKKEYSTKPYSFWLNQQMITARWFGEKIGKMFDITNHCFRKALLRTANWSRDGPFIPAPLHMLWPNKHLDNFESAIIEGKSYYREHNERVKKIVPKDRLLIWNVKDGWEPLCKFLNKDIPKIPIPHVNKTGSDDTFMAEFIHGRDEFKREIKSAMTKNLGIFTAKVLLFSTAVGATIWYCKSYQQ
ncbi:unnamed protein product [Oikopleura dioica]|uniref:Uncharacterized protein n=1 Tax=Oikopleura dioica TaxID=34765 RepID=E4Y2X8_OIKDI|nr:unnamed protein product [Oikopleura dioica]